MPRLYHSDQTADKIYELDPDTLLDISSGGVSSPSTRPTSVGGIRDRLYHADLTPDKFYELDPDTFLDISGGGVGTPLLDPIGIGGMDLRLYAATLQNKKLFEIDPDTLLDISSGGVTFGPDPSGMGGIDTRLYTASSVNNRLFELDPDTLLDISSGGVVSPSVGGERDMGGLNSRLYHTNVTASKTFEIDPDTLLDISGGGVTTPSTSAAGIGGVKSVPPPVVDNPIPDQETTEGEPWDFIFAENTFSDPLMLPLTYTATLDNDDPLPSWITFTGVTRRFVGTPGDADTGVINIKVEAENTGGGSVTDTFQLTIININQGPIVDQGIDDQNATVNLDFTFQFPSDAFDDPDGDTLVYSARLVGGDPLPNWLVFDPLTRTFSGVPPEDFEGSLDIEVTADDGEV